MKKSSKQINKILRIHIIAFDFTFFSTYIYYKEREREEFFLLCWNYSLFFHKRTKKSIFVFSLPPFIFFKLLIIVKNLKG